LWRAVDQDGNVVDAHLQTRRDGAAAKRFSNGYYGYLAVSSGRS
jgi:transposase-like protein